MLRLSVEASGYEIVHELPVLGISKRGKFKEFPSILEKADALGKQLRASL